CLLNVTTPGASYNFTNTANITLTDQAGNQLVTSNINYTVDNRAPTAGTLSVSPTSIITGSNAPVALSWTAPGGGVNCTASTPCTITSSADSFTSSVTDNVPHNCG